MLYYLPAIISCITFSLGIFALIKGLRQQPLFLYLALIIIALSVRLIIQSLFQLGYYNSSYFWISFFGGLQFVIPPAVYLHLQLLLGSKPIERKSILFHFIPSFMVTVNMGLGLLVFRNDNWSFLTFEQFQLNLPSIIPNMFLFFSFAVIALFYAIKCFKSLTQAVKTGVLIGEQGAVIMNWSLFVFLPLVVILSLFLSNLFLFNRAESIGLISEGAIMVKSLFLGIMVFFVMKTEALRLSNPLSEQQIPQNTDNSDFGKAENYVSRWKTESESENIKLAHALYQNQDNISRLILKIDEFVSDVKPFRDANYTIENLSRDISIPQHHIRYLFKYHHNAGFVDYRNYHRTQDLLENIKEKGFQNKKLESLCLECGFGSQSAMVRAFKKFYGATPNDVIYQSILD